MSGLEQEFPGKVKAVNQSAAEPAAHDEAKRLGFKSHGLVIRTTEGRVLWKAADHNVRMDEVKKELRQLLTS